MIMFDIDAKGQRQGPATAATIRRLLQTSARKRLYVAFHYPSEPLGRSEHRNQARQRLLLTGDFGCIGKELAGGMSILKSERDVEAADFMRLDPLVYLGLSRFELRLWEVCQGTLTLQGCLSRKVNG
jgi:hypothetical protein